MNDDVYIIGAGIHPFGRTDGRSGRDQGVFAVREALADAGLEWPDVEFAYGGSAAAGSADIMVNELGLTSVPFINVANGCATGGSALTAARNSIAAGACDIALAVGFDKHPRGAFNAKPSDYGLPEWYGETGMMLTTQFFALKIQRYMALHGISRQTRFVHGPLHRPVVPIVNLHAVGGQFTDVAILEKNEALRLTHQRKNVRGNEIFPLAQPDHQVVDQP